VRRLVTASARAVAIGSVLWSAGCAVTPEPYTPEVVRDPVEVRYALTLETTPKRLVRIEVGVAGSSDGITEFALDEGFGGVTQAGSEFVRPEASDERGAPLQVERPSSYAFIVRHAPGAHVTLRYTLPETAPKTPFVESGQFRPVLTASLLHLIGDVALVTPRHLDTGTERVIDLEFIGFDTVGWNGATSFRPDLAPIRMRRSLGAFRHSVVIAGDVDVECAPVGGRPVAVAMQRNVFAFQTGEFATRVRRIVELQRAYFADDDMPFFLVSAIGIEGRRENGFSLGGTGLTQSFASFLPRDAAFRAENDEAKIIDGLLAHEMAHHWIGGMVAVKQPEAAHAWFTEGFTEFVARRVLADAGLLTRAQALDELNATLVEYAQNPEKNAPATRIAEAFWTDPNVGDLPYQRGNLIAIVVDHAIRERSGGKSSIDDLLRELVRDAKTRPLLVDTEDLLLRISAWGGSDVAQRVRACVVAGATVELDPLTYAPGLRYVPGDPPQFLDTQASPSP
jgi:predicted metalloprotease with PDZ domain